MNSENRPGDRRSAIRYPPSSKTRRPQTLLAVTLDLAATGGRPLHAHAANEFLLTREGRGTHRTHMGALPFRPGALHFFPRGQLHEHLPDEGPCRAVSVRFRDAALVAASEPDRQAQIRLAFLKRRAFAGRNELTLSASTAQRIETLFTQAVREDAARESGYKCVLKGIALHAIVLIGRDPKVGFTAGRPEPARGLVRVLETLNEDPSRPVTVTEMARLAGMSRSHFHAVFKAATGATLMEHVARLRFGMATHLLKSTEMPIVDVCYHCGFAGMSRFYDVFLRYGNRAPAAFRKHARQRPAPSAAKKEE